MHRKRSHSLQKKSTSKKPLTLQSKTAVASSYPTVGKAEAPDALSTNPVSMAPDSSEKKGNKHDSVPRPSVLQKQDIA